MKVFLAILVVFTTILSLINLMEDAGRFSGKGVAFTQLIELTLLSAPETVYDFLPMIVILSSLAFCLGLARSSELVVTRALGWSATRVLLAPVTMALVVGATAVTVLNPIAASTANRYESLSTRYHGLEDNAFSIGSKGLWLRQGTREGQAIVHAVTAKPDLSEFRNVTFLEFDTDHLPSQRISAETATLGSGIWELTNVKLWYLNELRNPEAGSQRLDVLRIPTSLTRESIATSFGATSSISFWDLRDHIAELEHAGFSARRPHIRLQTEFAQPLFLTTMVLIGAAFSMKHVRFHHTGLMALCGVMSGFLLYFIRNFALALGENGQIPVMLAVWGPPVAGLLFALGLILHLEDG